MRNFDENLQFNAYCSSRRAILPAKNPHEDKLHNVRVEKKELSTAIALRARDSQHSATCGCRGGRVGKENVFQGTKLSEKKIRMKDI